MVFRILGSSDLSISSTPVALVCGAYHAGHHRDCNRGIIPEQRIIQYIFLDFLFRIKSVLNIFGQVISENRGFEAVGEENKGKDEKTMG